MITPGRARLAVAAVTLLAVAAMVLGAARWVATRPGRVCLTEACELARWIESHRGRAPTSVDGFAHDPALGWVLQPNLRPNPSHASRITSDPLGARGLTPRAHARTTAPRVVALGDSYTFGSCVHDDETWPAALERAMPGVEVVNLGVPGYGLDQSVLRWERDGAAYRPDAVVLGYIDDDVGRTAMRFFAYAKPMFELDGDGLRLTGVPVPAPAELLARESALIPTARRDLAGLFHLDARSAHPRHGWHPEEVSRRLLRRLDRAVTAAGAALVVVYLPVQREVLAPVASQVFARTCPRATPARCLDVTDALRAVAAADPATDHFRCHYSPALHTAVAARVADRLRPALAAPR